MNLRSILKRSLALLLVLASVAGLVPAVFAEDKGSIDDIHIEVPEYLKDEGVVEATFGENGEIVYRPASEQTISAVNGGVGSATTKAITDSAGTTILENRAGNGLATQQRLAFFIDPSNTEGNSNYKTYTLNANIIKNLVAAGVTDLFVMVKSRAGVTPSSATAANISLTNLNLANTNKGSAKVYAWVHCARDPGYLKKYNSSAQYHFKNKYSYAETDGANGNTGLVHLGNANYIKYMEDLMKDIAATTTDGILLDSVRFLTEFTGWDTDMKTYFQKTLYPNDAATAKTNYNNCVKYLCATAYTDYGASDYKVKAGSDGYLAFNSSGTAYNNANTLSAKVSTQAVKDLGKYRQYVITNFIGKMKTAFGSSKIIAVALERDYDQSTYQIYVRGQNPNDFKNHVKNGFCVTMQVCDNHSSAPVTLAKKVAKYTNVMVGVDFYNKESPNSNGYSTNPDAFFNVAEAVYQARFEVNKAYATYRGSILGSACYTAGHIGAQKISLNGTGKTPKATITFSNPNIATTNLLGYFHKHRDTDCYPVYSTSVNAGKVEATSPATMDIFVNWDSSSNPYIVVSSTSYDGYSVSAFGKAVIVVQLKNYTNDYAKLPFARVLLYKGGTSTSNIVGYYPIHVVATHETCTKFTTTWISEANCTTKGFKQHKCTTCGYTYIEEVAKLGHSYTVEQSVTQPTCTAAGSKVMKCSRCTATQTTTLAATGHSDPIYVDNGSNHKITCSKCDRLEYGAHTYTNGVCTLCGHVAVKFLHFKNGSAEITWDWKLTDSNAAKVSMDGSGNGKMYAAFNGSTAPSFYVDAASADKVDHPITSGDVVQIRMRVVGYTGDATNVSPSVSFDIGSGSFSTALTGDTINLANSDWQIVDIPINNGIYAAGKTIEQIKIAPFGDAKAAATVEIDYIYIGEPGRLPVTVTFVNYDGSVFEVYPIDMGAGVTYTGPTPTRPNENNFKYTFKGWKDSSGNVVDLNAKTFTANATLTAYYDAEYADPDHIASSKQLVDNDGNLEDYSYDLVIDAYSYGQHQTLQKNVITPMDITIVFDRSSSMAFPAAYSDAATFPNTSAGLTKLNNYLAKLDKTKPEGYYTASNMLGTPYTGILADPHGLGTCSYENMRWNATKNTWEVWQTLCYYDDNDGTKGTLTLKNQSPYNKIEGVDEYNLIYPASVIIKNDNFTYHQEGFGEWVPVTKAYSEFYERLTKCVNGGYIWEYTAAQIATIQFRIGESRRGRIQAALDEFVDTIYATNANLPEGKHHRISVIGYGRGTYVMGNTASPDKVERDLKVSTGSTGITLNSATAVKNLKTYIDNVYAFGQTYTDDALREALAHVNAMNSKANGRQGIVILVTDGAPTHGSKFELETANAALVNAEQIKNKAKLYAIGFMPDINAATNYTGTYADGDAESVKANNFLHLVSSNFTDATTMVVKTNTGNSDAGYYISTVDGGALATQFAAIFSSVKEETDITTAIDGPMILHDIIKREWDVVGEGTSNLDITVQRCDYLGNGEFAAPTTLATSAYSVGALTEIAGTGGDRSITIEWKDAPNAWLRETPLEGQTTLGYKILVTIGIKLDRDSTIGGNNIDTNGAGSGAYYPDITNPTLKTIWEIPNVNVEPLYDYKIHDFFMDLYNPNAAIDLIRAEKNDAKTNNGIVQANMYSITQAVDGWNNKYVSINHYLNKYTKETIIDKDGDEITTFAMGDPMVEQNLTHGATAWSKIAYDTAFDFSKDNSLLTAGYVITPTTTGVDSLGRDPWFSKEIPVEDGIVNYYAPKYTVLDFGTKVEVPLDNEAYLDMGRMSDMIGLSDDTMSLTYNFMNGTKIMNEMGTFQYNVTAINAPKGAPDNNVARTFTVLPANNVMYEETYLTNDGNWVDLGLTGEELAKREERVQSENVTTEHGYDSNLHELGKSEDYSFNHAYVIEASAAKNNKTLTFSFTGSGFDVISRTGPEDGVMVVEVYTDEAMTKKADTALSINYLKDTTLYQIPVVRFMEIDADKDGDPDYGTYYVKIRAYYWDGFNPNYSATAVSSDGSARKDPAIKQVCADLGITVEELEAFLAASGLSGNTKPATRNAAGADNSYEVVVDGIRIYNPLGTVTQAAMPEAYYIYGKANELNPTFINARDALLDATSWTFDGANDQDANGIVYIAAGSSNTNSSEQVSGIHLSMDGALKTKTVDGVEYLLDAAGNFVQAPGYTSNVYVRKVKNEESGRTTYNYFCKDASGNEINVTGKMKITYWNSNYDVNGPKNEIYLQYNSGVAFNVGTNAGRVMIGAKSSDGQNVFLQVYSEKDGKFVNVYAHENADGSKQEYSSNRTELYYDVTDYVTANGDVIIRNPLEKVNGAFQKGIMSISGIKLLPKDGNSKMGLRAPASTVQKAVELIGNNALPEITTLDNVNLGEQLYLENDLTMVFRVKESLLADYDLSTAYLVVEKDIYGSDGSVTVDVQILREYTVMDGRVVFTYSGISAAQMNDEIRLILHIFDSYGNEYVTKEKTTSVANYLKGLLEAMPTGQDKLYTLIMDMLNYGTAAQMYFDRHTDAPVNEAFPIFAEYASYASAGLNTALENLGGQIANEGSVAKLNQALDLGTRVGITYKVTLPEGMDPADAKLVIKDAEGKVLDTLEVAGNATDSRGRYLVTFYGSTSRDMRRVVYATVISGDAAISDTYTYSISTYAWGVYLQGGDPELIALTQAMVMYGDSAVAYFG